jgi:tetratricopeptide (TPR) repeat protein
MYALTTQGYPPLEFKSRIDDIVDKYPQRYFPRNLLAQFYFYNKDFKQAAYHYERLLQHPELPNKPVMLDRLAIVYMPIDMLKSTQYAQQAYELDKTNPSILTTYGWLLTQQNRPEECLSMLRKALARSQQNPAIHYYIVVSLDRLGLIPQAISGLEALFTKKSRLPNLLKRRPYIKS